MSRCHSRSSSHIDKCLPPHRPLLSQFRTSSGGGGGGALAAAAGALGSLSNSLTMPEWLPSGPFNVGSFNAGLVGRSFGMSPHALLGSTPPFGKSVDMVDMCAQLMESGGGWGCMAWVGGRWLACWVECNWWRIGRHGHGMCRGC